jgi:hypothetical protein
MELTVVRLIFGIVNLLGAILCVVLGILVFSKHKCIIGSPKRWEGITLIMLGIFAGICSWAFFFY